MSAADLSLLKAVRERIATPEKWTQGAYARDRNGQSITVSGKDPVCWCLAGAAGVRSFVGCPESRPPRTSLAGAAGVRSFVGGIEESDLAKRLGFSSAGEMIEWNDDPTRTHAEVLSRIEDAIKRLEGE